MSTNTLLLSAIQPLARDINYFRTIRRIRTERTKMLDNALKLVGNRHVTFNSLGFNQQFLQNEAADLIEPFLYGGAPPHAASLAQLWAYHFRLSRNAKLDLAQRVLPMMSDFVYLLEHEVEQVYDLEGLVASLPLSLGPCVS